MREQVVYLDSSTIVKRYIEEPGSSVVRELYFKAYTGEVILSFSVWNIGEVLEAFDIYAKIFAIQHIFEP